MRVDQLWDSSIHNYKLTETTADAGADEYDCYIFTVRRKFDWENKYTGKIALRDLIEQLLTALLAYRYRR